MESGIGNQPADQRAIAQKELIYALVQWQQAACKFHGQYETLQKIAVSHQTLSVLTKPQEKLVFQRTSKAIEQARLDMTQFLEKILQDMESTGHSAEETINELCHHTVQLQELTKEIQQTIWLSSLPAC